MLFIGKVYLLCTSFGGLLIPLPLSGEWLMLHSDPGDMLRGERLLLGDLFTIFISFFGIILDLPDFSSKFWLWTPYLFDRSGWEDSVFNLCSIFWSLITPLRLKLLESFLITKSPLFDPCLCFSSILWLLSFGCLSSFLKNWPEWGTLSLLFCFISIFLIRFPVKKFLFESFISPPPLFCSVFC